MSFICFFCLATIALLFLDSPGNIAVRYIYKQMAGEATPAIQTKGKDPSAMKTITDTEATAEEIKRTVEDTCGAEGLEFRVTELGEHLVIDVATINQCCHQNKPGVWWGIWVTDEFSGEPTHDADEEHLCPGCQFNANRNSCLASAVVVDLADPGEWATKFAAAVKECVDWRAAWREERRARATRMLEREIAQRLADGAEMATNAEAGTEDDPDEGAWWSIWREDDIVFGWMGWGERSEIEDVMVEQAWPTPA